MKYNVCIVGNGILGAAAADFESRADTRTIVLGAAYGADGAFFSSHEDESRIVRGFHSDPYWAELTERNVRHVGALMASTGLPVLIDCPVLYAGVDAAEPCGNFLLPRKHASCAALPTCFTHEDRLGGILRPKLYIHAMNEQARRRGAKIVRTVVRQIRRAQGGIRVTADDGEILASRVVDTRGVHGERLAERGLKILAKVLCYGRAMLPARPLGFLRRMVDGPFHDAYGLVTSSVRSREAEVKLGFTERAPIELESTTELREWFRGEYVRYPYLAEAVYTASTALGSTFELLKIKPCAFTVTSDGRPYVEEDRGLWTITGCNGMAAKCAQALVEKCMLPR